MKFRGLTLVVLVTAPFVGLMACQSIPDEESDTLSSDSAGEVSSLPGEGITVRPGVTDWIEEHYQAEIVNIGLEELGYEVEDLQEAAYPVLYTAIANGDLDFMANSFQRSQDELIQNAGGDEKFEKVGALYPFVHGYQIDKQTADEYQITSLEQLQDPEIAQLFDSDGDGKANFLGCDPGWYCEKVIETQLDAYELRDTVEVDKGEYTALLPDVISRYEQGDPVLFYVFYPHWVASVLKPDEDVVWLEVPFTIYPDDYEEPLSEEDTTFEGKNLGLIVDSYIVVASDEFLDANPVARRWFELVQIPIEDVNAESLRIRDGENTPEDIRRHAEEWVAQNRDQVDQWLEEARQAAN